MSVVTELDSDVTGKSEDASDEAAELCCLRCANRPHAPALALGTATASFVYEYAGFSSTSSNSNCIVYLVSNLIRKFVGCGAKKPKKKKKIVVGTANKFTGCYFRLICLNVFDYSLIKN